MYVKHVSNKFENNSSDRKYPTFFLSFLDVYSACAGAPPFGVVLVLIKVKVSKLL